MTGIIILAAGNSSRLGQPKQLLLYKDVTLLQHIIREASIIKEAVVIVVTGANHELIEKEINSSKIKSAFNRDWELGMSSSINIGLNKALQLFPKIEKCILAVCDQPFISYSIFKNLIDEYHKTGKRIVASSYAETLGTPVLFDKKYFNELLNLKGQEGAKKIINQFFEDTTSIPFQKGDIDVDTEEDYNKLISEL
jgi:molybdenum cofactor cytidylyltransferase